MGYYHAGFEVVGVDIESQPHYPFEFHQADAVEFPLEGYDAYHDRPTCQKWTKKNLNWGRRRVNVIEHLDCLTPVRERFVSLDKTYIIENVNGSPLDGTLMLCVNYVWAKDNQAQIL